MAEIDQGCWKVDLVDQIDSPFWPLDQKALLSRFPEEVTAASRFFGGVHQEGVDVGKHFDA